MVDDGSTDATGDIAREFARRDARFRVLSQDNAGLGAARNTGAAATDGEFLCFVDGDDIIPHHSYERLHAALAGSGSDFATGNVHRFGETRQTRQSPMLEAAFKSSQTATHVRDRPTLLADRIIPNKLWRRSFWDEHRFQFPTGVLHEDIPVAIPAHVLAEAVDVVSEPCYLYRVRESGDSITQRRLDQRAIRDRHRAVTEASGFLRGRGENRLKRAYDELCAAQDFRYTLQVLDEADESFQRLFLELVNDFFDRAHRGVFAGLPAIDRLKWHLVRRRLMPELLEVLRFEKSGEIAQHRHVRRRGKIYGDYPFRTDRRLRIPANVYRLDQELSMRTRIDDVWWEDGRLQLSGRAFIRGLDLPTADSDRLRLHLQTGADRRVALPVQRVARPEVTASERTGLYDYRFAGFRASVAVDELRAWDGTLRRGTWQLTATIRAEGQVRSKRVSDTAPGRAGRPDGLRVDGARIVPRTASGRFGITVDPLDAVVESWGVDQDVLDLCGTLRSDDLVPEQARLLLVRASDGTALQLPLAASPGPAPGAWSIVARVPLRTMVDELDLSDVRSHVEERGTGVEWHLLVRTSTPDSERRLSVSDSLGAHTVDVLGREVVVTRDHLGLATLQERVHRPVVTGVRAADGGDFRLTGQFRDPAAGPFELVLSAADRVEHHRFPLERSGFGFTASVPAGAIPTLAGRLPLTEGTWHVLVAPAGATAPMVPVVLATDAASVLPASSTAGAKTFVLTDEGSALLLEVGPDLLPEEAGRFNQHRLRDLEAPAFARLGLRDQVLFESYGAKQFGDNPRAIFEELRRRDTGLELLWSVEDAQTELPDGVRPVRRGSRAWYEAQARSRFLVTCVYRSLQRPWDLSPGQQVLQTWHGAPLKRIGFDSRWIGERASRDYYDRLRAEISGWTHLVSPSTAATPILRSAFRYRGQLLETGYPRNDIFFRSDREELAKVVRSRLGLPDGKKVVLYAPTFRDRNLYRRNRFRLEVALDIEAAEARLGEEHVLLVRRHAKVVDSPVLRSGNRFSYDVSMYPDVNELLLVTDVLVTDYSSMMFDFANTGRPMVFFTYDLESYRDVRAFYFDLAETVPGPMVATADAALEAIAAAEDHRAAGDERYRRFRATFCSLEDGSASRRVVDAVFR